MTLQLRYACIALKSFTSFRCMYYEPGKFVVKVKWLYYCWVYNVQKYNNNIESREDGLKIVLLSQNFFFWSLYS